jgi:hypothetical protein
MTLPDNLEPESRHVVSISTVAFLPITAAMARMSIAVSTLADDTEPANVEDKEQDAS